MRLRKQSEIECTGPSAELDNISVVGDGGVSILHGVSLAAQKGERVLITGPSGSGKSTALRTLSGIETPERIAGGTARILGKDVYALRDRARERLIATNVGLGFQTPELDNNFSVQENLLNHYELVRGGRPSLRRMARLAVAFGISEQLSQCAGTLSGGQKLRAAMVRAILPPSEVLILDEPTHMLDVQSKTEVYAALADISVEDGSTLIMVSHDPEARSIATREVTIDGGVVTGSSVIPSNLS